MIWCSLLLLNREQKNGPDFSGRGQNEGSRRNNRSGRRGGACALPITHHRANLFPAEPKFEGGEVGNNLGEASASLEKIVKC